MEGDAEQVDKILSLSLLGGVNKELEYRTPGVHIYETSRVIAESQAGKPGFEPGDVGSNPTSVAKRECSCIARTEYFVEPVHTPDCALLGPSVGPDVPGGGAV